MDPMTPCLTAQLIPNLGSFCRKKIRGATWWPEPWPWSRQGPQRLVAQESMTDVHSYAITARALQVKSKTRTKSKEADHLGFQPERAFLHVH